MNEQELMNAVEAKKKQWHDLHQTETSAAARKTAGEELEAAKNALSDFLTEGAKTAPDGSKPFGFLKRRAYTHDGQQFPTIYCVMSLKGFPWAATGPTPAAAVANWNTMVGNVVHA